MAGQYKDPPGHRLAWDKDCIGFYYLSTDVAATTMSPTERAQCNDETSNAAVDLGAGTPTWYVGIIFPQLMDIEGYFVVSDAGGTWTEFSYSNDTTDGFDGTWIVADTALPYSSTSGSVTPDYRTGCGVVPITMIGKKAVRFTKTGGGNKVYGLHLYGFASGAPAQYLDFWHANSDIRLLPSTFDCGNCPQLSSQDLQFRIKNWSPDTVATVTLDFEALTIAGTVDQTHHFYFQNTPTHWSHQLVIDKPMAPLQTSDVQTIRRISPSTADLGPWCLRVVMTVVLGSGTILHTAAAYIYLGDVDTSIPFPHIWHLTPDKAARGQNFSIIGAGFDTGGVTSYADPSAIPYVSQAIVAATGNAYGSSRIIDSATGPIDPQHEELIATVPSTAVSGVVQVETII